MTFFRKLPIEKKKYQRKAVLSILFLIVVAVCNLCMPIYIGRAVDVMVGKGEVDFVSLRKILTVFGIFYVARSAFSLSASRIQQDIFYELIRDLRCRAQKKLMRLDMKTLERYSKGEILSRIINDTDTIANILLQGFSSMVVGALTIIMTVIVILILNWKLALLLIGFTPVAWLITGFISKMSYRFFKKTATTRGNLMSYVEEAFSTMEEQKAFGREQANEKIMQEYCNRLYDSGWPGQFFSSLPNPTMRFLNAVIYLSVTVSSAHLVLTGRISVGLMVAFLKYTTQFIQPFNDITAMITQMQSANASADRLKEFFGLPEEEDVSGEKTGNPSENIHPETGIVAENLSFSYTEEPFIRNMNFEVQKGMKVAVVGKTGCGKTTLMNLLLGFYSPDGGSLRLDGREIISIPKDELREKFSPVLQDSVIFRGTVADNIAYADPSATREEIIDAAKKAYAHDFIIRLKNGYDTMLEENGSNLSQGERQLICIARTMLNLSEIIVLDEATSDIDTRNEIRIRKAFDRLLQNHTAFIVAHRLSTIESSDLILVMDDGVIVEQGSHEELMRRGGLYSEMQKAMR